LIIISPLFVNVRVRYIYFKIYLGEMFLIDLFLIYNMKTLSCRDAGCDCNYVDKGETEEVVYFIPEFTSILAGVLSALFGLDWYKDRKQNRKLARKAEDEVEDYNAKEPLAEQLA
jgi:hypothetical protein